MKLICQQLQLVIVILFACPNLAIEAPASLKCDGRNRFLVDGRCFLQNYHPKTYEDARTTCQENGLVLARIYSTAQLDGVAKRVKEFPNFRILLPTFWVGASDHEGRFLWSADNSELKRDSPLWNKGQPNNGGAQKHCVQINTNGRLDAVPCNFQNSFLCMALPDGFLLMKVNNIEMSRNKVVHIEKDKHFDVICYITNNYLKVELTLTLNDEVLRKGAMRSLIFRIPVATCNHSGIYSCKADFLDTDPIVTASTSISMNIGPCSKASNVSDVNNSSIKADMKRPICSGKNTQLAEGNCFRYFEGLATFKMAEELCLKNDSVLASFKSSSQMQNIFKEMREGQSVWVDDINVQDSASFRLIANKKGSRTDSPMSSKGLTITPRQDSCLVRYPNLSVVKSDCATLHRYICMNLFSEVLTVTVNDEPTKRNAEIFIRKNSTITIDCLAETTNNSIIMSIRFKDHLIMTVSNQSRLVYDVENAQCEKAGTYSCNVDFTDSRISVEHFIFIDMDCPVTVTLSIVQMVATPSHNVMTSVGSDLSFNCTVKNAKDHFYLEILKNDKEIITQYNISTVTFNLSVAGCYDSDVYTCRYHQLHPEMDTKSSPLYLSVDKCPTLILSFVVHEAENFKYDYYDVWPDTDGISRGNESPDKQLGKYVQLVCNAETYSRPTTLLIKTESGNVLSIRENTSIIYHKSLSMPCRDKGKVVCQINDHLRNETDSKTRYIWVRRCEPSLCRRENHFRRLVPHRSHNVRATFCFMMDRTLHTIQEIQLFHEGRLLETNSRRKQVINIMADKTNPFQYTLDVTLVNVQVEDFGRYVIQLKFNDRNVLTFLIKVNNSVTVQTLSDESSSSTMSYELPCVIFLLLVLALLAIYSIVKKTSF